MGFFSWKTSDTNKSISNVYSTRGALPVYLITPKNEKIFESSYEGYGDFGGYDAYALLANWNAPNECNGDSDHDREIGIRLCYIDGIDVSTKLKYPLKFAESPNVRYEDLEPSETCEAQGFFYCDNEYDEDDEYDEW